MSNAGIISPVKKECSVIYSANLDMTRDLVAFMIKDCCSVEFVNIREDKIKRCSIVELVNCLDPETKTKA